MARDGSGTFSLPAGNPVIIDTIIDPDWANSTLGEIAVALTNSLDRTGVGSMLAQFKSIDGSAGSPGMSFGLDPDTGFARLAANKFAVVAGGVLQAIYENGKQPPSGFCPLNHGAFGDGVNDDSAAWIACAAAVVAANDPTATAFGQAVVINGMGRIYMLKNKTVLDNLDGVKITNCMFRFMAGGNVTTTNPMLVLSTSCANTTLEGVIFDGGKTGACLSLLGTGCRLVRSIVYHYKGFGVEFTTAGGADRGIEDCLINEWITSDSEFSNNANYTATGVLCNDYDCHLYDSIVRFSGKNVRVQNGGFDMAGTHVYNGGAGFVLKTNAINLQVDATAGHVRLKDCYLDNGQHKLYNHDVSIDSCFLFLDPARVTIVDGFITLHANGDAAPDKFKAGNWAGMSNNLRANNVVPLVALVPESPNVWSVDSSSIEMWVSFDRTFSPEAAIVKFTDDTRAALTILSVGDSFDGGGMLAFADSTTLLTPREEMPSIRVVGEHMFFNKHYTRVISMNASLVNVVLAHEHAGALITVFGTGTLTLHVPETLEQGFVCEVIQEDATVTVDFVEDGSAVLHQFANSGGPWVMQGRYAWARVHCVYNVGGSDANVRITGDVA